MFFFRKRLRRATSEENAAFRKRCQDGDVGFRDGIAMVVSAFFVLVLPALLVLIALAGIVMLVFGLL